MGLKSFFPAIWYVGFGDFEVLVSGFFTLFNHLVGFDGSFVIVGLALSFFKSLLN
jgi:hypothetical protein